jgi:ornithine cyclodeaminase/alanine dehydrogenase-like protein (mu-crystallin family)
MTSTERTGPPAETLALTRAHVASLLGYDECIAAVEAAFRLHAEGKSLQPAVLGVAAREGRFHVKAAGLDLGRLYFAAKTNGNFPDNPRRRGRPAIQGLIVLCDGDDGRPLAVLDSIEITLRRTAAATAVAAKWLARTDSRVATLCGCGAQGRAQLRALARVLPLRRAYAFDADPAAARAFAAELSSELGLEVTPVADHAEAVRRSDVCVTCTPARRPLLGRDHVAPGTFVAAIGADSADKQELEPALMAAGVVVVDVLEQCAEIGDLHHALRAGALTRESVHAELADLVAGRKPGRRTPDEITIFDSTGTALQDVAAAALVYEKAVAAGAGIPVAFGK